VTTVTATLARQTFRIKRSLEYFTAKELTLQTGHAPERWPDVVVKELIDNALDACEGAGVMPDIRIALDHQGLSVADNGPGLPADVVAAVLDFDVRVSSKDTYISPTRGAQGNALKTVLAIPYVLSGCQMGEVVIRSLGQRHRIRVTVDRLAQEPRITSAIVADRVAKIGTCVEVRWPKLARLEAPAVGPRFLQLLEAYALLNPHASLTVTVKGVATRFTRTTPTCRKWIASTPTSPHWYTPDQFRHLIAAYIASERDGLPPRTVREFISEFRGLSSTAKQKAILSALPIKGMHLHDYVTAGDVDHGAVDVLLTAMQAASAPVKPQALGVLGGQYLRSVMVAHGCQPATLRSKRVAAIDDTSGRPFVLEVAFGVRDDSQPRRLITGINWAPTLVDPFREFAGYGIGLDGLLHDLRVATHDPVTVVIHLACPHLPYTDRGKSGLEAL
jgi:DNA topoisomerase VI subunit B